MIFLSLSLVNIIESVQCSIVFHSHPPTRERERERALHSARVVVVYYTTLHYSTLHYCTTTHPLTHESQEEEERNGVVWYYE